MLLSFGVIPFCIFRHRFTDKHGHWAPR